MLRKYIHKGNNSRQKPESAITVTVIRVWTKELYRFVPFPPLAKLKARRGLAYSSTKQGSKQAETAQILRSRTDASAMSSHDTQNSRSL